MTDIESNWPYETIVPKDGDAVYDLLVAIETELDRIDVQADELQEQRFINTATTEELRKLAAEVGVTKETNESEERFRFRAKLAKAVARCDGTFPKFAQVLRLIFGEDAQQITVSAPAGEPVVKLTIPSELINDIPLTLAELEAELLNALPASDGLEVISDDTWLLGESGSQGLGEGGLS